MTRIPRFVRTLGVALPVAMSLALGTIDAFAPFSHVRRIFIHVNNSNPALVEGSPQAETVAAAGWEIAHDGLEIRP